MRAEEAAATTTTMRQPLRQTSFALMAKIGVQLHSSCISVQIASRPNYQLRNPPERYRTSRVLRAME
jgi:hypothetical protein